MKIVFATWKNDFQNHGSVAYVVSKFYYQTEPRCDKCGSGRYGGYYVSVSLVDHDGCKWRTLEKRVLKSESHTEEAWRRAHMKHINAWDNLIERVWNCKRRKMGEQRKG